MTTEKDYIHRSIVLVIITALNGLSIMFLFNKYFFENIPSVRHCSRHYTNKYIKINILLEDDVCRREG